ncbi:sensor histidine kinase [Caenimonas aquaedulcis]|uniref:histidine kinase n=1 Tax=Caenimonas aquaedulcis TaxID=2793270 RepID=A0A931H1V1_9BURK|nr:GAF domain-containing sensor histidine kinase [Caenimonas aquaedulcis]MBG9387041.1 GAF domain-containing sensor histidine kinase [Caenimonas aquaedulcis]
MDDSPSAIARDIAVVSRIGSVPSLLKIICDNTGMRFAAVARVTDGTWTACAVEDQIEFGLVPGSQLDVHTTLCKESRAARAPVVIDQASRDPDYRDHHTPRLYNIESYISVPIVRPNGEYFGNLCAIDPRPAVVSDPKIVSMFQSFAELIGRQLDIEQKQEETEIALLDARATVELREQFIAVLGHDLRNPLSSVAMIAEILARRSEEQVAGYGQRLRASARRMSRLIEDVLDFARGRMGAGMGLHIEPVTDLAANLRDVVQELRDSNAARAIEEQYRIDGIVECDLNRVQRLLSNLLGNALAYGAPGEPVRVDVHSDAAWLCLSVRNGGDPIPGASLEKIFEPYWRPPETKAGGNLGGGLGLGLHICSQIVRAHGGTLQVSSSREDGTCFTARMPVRQGMTATA